MDGALQAIFNSAQTALKNDALQTLYNGAQARQNAFAKINNAANQSHMLFSLMPLENLSHISWFFSKGIKEINEQAAKIESAVPSSFK